MQSIPSAIRTLLKSRSMTGTDAPRCLVRFTRADATTITVQVASCRVSREYAASAQRVVVTWPNVSPTDPTDVGYYTPDRGDDDPALLNDWHQVLYPGRKLEVFMGYGTQLAQVFTGEIDDVYLGVDPGNSDLYIVQVDARDTAGGLIDKTVSDGAGNYSLTYTNQLVENIVTDLLTKAGFDPADITTEPTGIAANATFEQETYADALVWCRDITGFELVIDEFGKAIFRYPTDRQPQSVDEPAALVGTTPWELAHAPIVADSEVVTANDGVTTYVRGTDYEMDYATGTITRVPTGAITDGQTVMLDYVYPAWTWQQGVDLFRLGYTISRRNIYGTIRVEGEDGLVGTYTNPQAAAYGIPLDKVLFVSSDELHTQDAVNAAAAQIGNDMTPRVREVQFAAVGNPWIQVGDCGHVVESSTTISEVYRVTSIEMEMDQTGFIMSGVAYYYGYAPLV